MQSNESRCDGKDPCLTHHPAAAFASCPHAYMYIRARFQPDARSDLQINELNDCPHHSTSKNVGSIVPLPCRNSPHLSNLCCAFGFRLSAVVLVPGDHFSRFINPLYVVLFWSRFPWCAELFELSPPPQWCVPPEV